MCGIEHFILLVRSHFQSVTLPKFLQPIFNLIVPVQILDASTGLVISQVLMETHNLPNIVVIGGATVDSDNSPSLNNLRSSFDSSEEKEINQI